MLRMRPIIIIVAVFRQVNYFLITMNQIIIGQISLKYVCNNYIYSCRLEMDFEQGGDSHSTEEFNKFCRQYFTTTSIIQLESINPLIYGKLLATKCFVISTPLGEQVLHVKYGNME